jgi:mitochondrial import receptor subunit TOM20
MITSTNQAHRLLFSSDLPLPPEVPIPPSPPEVQEARRAAQIKFVEYLKKENRVSPLLIACFVARQIAAELQKMVDATTGTIKNNLVENDFTDSDGTDYGYGIGDHMERLRYLEVQPDKEEVALLSNVLQMALPGLEGFVLAERHAILSGKVAYNAFGVCFSGGRDNRVCCWLFYPFIRLTFSLYSQSRHALPKMLRRLGHHMVPNVRLEVPYTQSPHI